MYKTMLGIIALAAILAGCQANGIPAETSSQAPVEVQPLMANQTYQSIDELVTAFETATASSARNLFDGEKVYYLSDDNLFDASLQEVQVAESYLNCIYDNGIMLITNRYEDGRQALEHMTANNPHAFSKKQVDGMEYYYAVEDGIEYYLWIQDDTYVQLNVPAGNNICLRDFVKNLEYRSLQ